MLKVRQCVQHAAYDCGTAVAQAIFAYHGVEWPGWELVGLSDKIDGTDPRYLEILFRSAGFCVTAGEMSVEDLRHHTGQGRPVAALIQRGGVGHWVVVRGFDSKCRIALMDPAEPKGTAIPRAAFEERWADVTREGTRLEKWAISVG